MITVGFDFGTHQTKVCIEEREGVELSYNFFKFKDTFGKKQYTLPSIIHIDHNGYLQYGYISPKRKGKIIRYFKQTTFTDKNNALSKEDSILYSIWYIAYILFDLEEIYGYKFSIQMGVPTDNAHFAVQKQLAVRIMVSAYWLVENVFENDKASFLNSTIDELKEKTKIFSYSSQIKEDYGVLVFPEAYACLMPLIKSSKVATGMSLMVDIGGGTTDISFFTIKNNKPCVYDFKSVNKGLNFLTEMDHQINSRLDSNVIDASEINKSKNAILKNEVKIHCVNLVNRLRAEFKKQCNLRVERLMDELSSRPIIYTGGGSTFGVLRTKYDGFRDIIHISEKEWRTKSVSDLDEIKSLGLCPILSIAYGLSIGVPNDEVECEGFKDIFMGLKGLSEEKHSYKESGTRKTSSYKNMDYYFSKDDYYTIK